LTIIMTILYSDPVFLRHETGIHPENPDRLRAILARLEETQLIGRCRPGTYASLSEAAVQAVHRPELIARARQASQRGGEQLDQDTVVSAESFKVALAAAGAAVAAVDAVLAGPDRTALCLVRPPGHHATPSRSMGFCLFNNVALAARHAIQRHGLQRVLIVDFDVHHGNGTQDIFYADPAVFFLSIHRFGYGFYPGTGAETETGTAAGLGTTLNVPVRFGTSRKEYQERFRKALARAADESNPELVLVSAGFDAHARDPIGSLGLEVEDFGELTRAVMEVARAHTGGKVVSCLEGGYHLQALAESVRAHLEGLLEAG
jgi:acetoin utilization deacetylase AcuC-like enzyme